jgi:hypothetical protein
MTFNELLVREGIKPEQVIVLRHRPYEPELAKVISWLAAEHPNVFNEYQQTHGPILEKAMLKLAGNGYVASFLSHGPGKAIFVGLYAISSSQALSETQYWQRPAAQRLRKFGMVGFAATKDKPKVECFDLVLQPFRSSWKGKLILDWPGGEKSWWRRSENNEFTICAILEESFFDAVMPVWNELRLSWEHLQILPRRWELALREWRGIYYIQDIADGKAYIGSAGGAENILGRWKNYAVSGHGNNRLLRDRSPETFQFSILERVSPDMKLPDLVALESSWKVRLGTRRPYGLNEN